MRSEVDVLIDDVFALILQRLTACTLCTSKCVCRSWNRLISESKYRKQLPQIVAGFFCRT
jgi:hypothetical protein